MREFPGIHSYTQAATHFQHTTLMTKFNQAFVLGYIDTQTNSGVQNITLIVKKTYSPSHVQLLSTSTLTAIHMLRLTLTFIPQLYIH